MMKNMRPEDLQFMARQMESLPPEQLQRMAAQMGSGSAGAGFDPSTLSGAARVMQQRQRYELDAAVRLKEEVHRTCRECLQCSFWGVATAKAAGPGP